MIQETLKKAKAHVKTRASYVFHKKRSRPEKWKVGTWSKYVSNSENMKYGTEQDKAQLPAPTRRNQSRQQTTRKRKIIDNNRVQRRASDNNRDVRPRAQQENNQEPAAPAPTGELPDLSHQLSEEAQERGRQIENRIAEEMQTEVAEITRNGRRTTDEDGNLIQVQERQGQERNAGDSNYRGWLSDRLEGG
jgi:hypothetical protein